MSNRLYNQFSYSPERQPISLMGKFTQTGAVAQAILINQGVTYNANLVGSAGNAITITLIVPAGDGSLSIVTVGNSITVTLAKASGIVTTTADLLSAAINADMAASALVNTTSDGTLGPLVGLATTHLSGGIDPTMTTNAMNMSMINSENSTYVIQLQDEFPEVLSAQVTTFKPDSSVTSASIEATNTAFGGTKTITIRTPQLAVGDGLFVHLILRNSSNP